VREIARLLDKVLGRRRCGIPFRRANSCAGFFDAAGDSLTVSASGGLDPNCLSYTSSMKKGRGEPELLRHSPCGGNLSALVTNLAEDARRRMAARAYLRRHKIAPITSHDADAIQAKIDRESC
jgi:hypothetical protein